MTFKKRVWRGKNNRGRKVKKKSQLFARLGRKRDAGASEPCFARPIDEPRQKPTTEHA